MELLRFNRMYLFQKLINFINVKVTITIIGN